MIEVLGKEKSNCPVCGKEIDAVVVIENNEMLIMKQCGDHGAFKEKIDKETELYNKWHVEEKDAIASKLAKKACSAGCKASCSTCPSDIKGKKQ